MEPHIDGAYTQPSILYIIHILYVISAAFAHFFTLRQRRPLKSASESCRTVGPNHRDSVTDSGTENKHDNKHDGKHVGRKCN